LRVKNCHGLLDCCIEPLVVGFWLYWVDARNPFIVQRHDGIRRQIADFLGMSINSVASRYRYAVARLRRTAQLIMTTNSSRKGQYRSNPLLRAISATVIHGRL